MTLKLTIVAHRGAWSGCPELGVPAVEKNSEAAFRLAVEHHFGIETDFRDICGKVVVSHNPPPADALSAQDFFNLLEPGQTVLVNIKADGLAASLEELRRHTRLAYCRPYAFDMSVPDTLEYEKADFPFLERLSEYETLGCTGSGNFPAHSGIWLDAFHKQWYGLEDIRTLLAHHRRVAIVSPDLHARPYGQVWDWVKELLKDLQTQPEDATLRRTIPRKVKIQNIDLISYQITVDFSKEYYDMKPTEEILTRAAIAKTLLQLSQYVTFTVDGKPLVDASGANVGAMNLDSFVENPGEQINSSQKATLKLYFSNKAGTRLVPETREVHYSSNISLEKLVMEQLIEGPRKSGLLATIPSETKLITITVVDGVCYVNLDEMFLNQNQEISEPVVLYSIVDSLTELTGIDKVQISINGDTSGKCRYTYKLSKMYEADDRLVTKESDEKVESTE